TLLIIHRERVEAIDSRRANGRNDVCWRLRERCAHEPGWCGEGFVAAGATTEQHRSEDAGNQNRCHRSSVSNERCAVRGCLVRKNDASTSVPRCSDALEKLGAGFWRFEFFQFRTNGVCEILDAAVPKWGPEAHYRFS